MPVERRNRLREYWEIILRRRWTVLTCFAIVLVAVMTATFLMTRIYRATLTLQIEQQESKTAVLGAAAAPNEMAFFDSQSFYQTQYELLKSDALAQRVIEQLNLVAPSQTAKKSKSWLDIFKKDDDKEDDATPEEAETGLMAGLPGALTVAPVRTLRSVRRTYALPRPCFTCWKSTIRMRLLS